MNKKKMSNISNGVYNKILIQDLCYLFDITPLQLILYFMLLIVLIAVVYQVFSSIIKSFGNHKINQYFINLEKWIEDYNNNKENR